MAIPVVLHQDARVHPLTVARLGKRAAGHAGRALPALQTITLALKGVDRNGAVFQAVFQAARRMRLPGRRGLFRRP